MSDLWDSLFDSRYDGVNLLVTLFGCAILYFGGLALIRWDQRRHSSSYFAPVRPPRHLVGDDAPKTLSEALRDAGLHVTEIPGWGPFVPYVPPGMKSVVVAASEAQARAQFRALADEIERDMERALFDQRLTPEQMQYGTPPFVAEMFGEPRHGFTILRRPPYDWQRDDSGLA